jgi:AraC family transcriptional regulator of adaptative response / DNA-3-methyladenine glycosylase II
VQLAKRLIDQSSLALAEVALRSGFGSVRRFNDEVRLVYGRSPRALRSSSVRSGSEDLELFLPVRQPYHAQWVFSFLKQRALAGIEEVEGLEYRRALYVDGQRHGWLRVSWRGDGLNLRVPAAGVINLGELLTRVRRIFDLDADSSVIDEDLRRDPLLAPQVGEDPGLRVPGAWDGFEIAVRAILGQQVSVARATQLATRLCTQYGGGNFPSPAELQDADVAELGMPGRRGAAVRALARGVLDGKLLLDESADPENLDQSLRALPGIGPWTAGYVGMRVARDPDAYVESDWVVLKMLDLTSARARRRAEAWRPWRAYAVMVLWRMASLQRAAVKTNNGAG